MPFITSGNWYGTHSDYPFLHPSDGRPDPKADFVHIKKDGYDELWHRISDDNFVVVVKRDNSGIEDITLFAYLFSAFLFLVAVVQGDGAADLVAAALEPAEDVLADEYPVADPYDDHFHQPVFFCGHRGGDDHLFYQPV
jgi:hypothetical protein